MAGTVPPMNLASNASMTSEGLTSTVSDLQRVFSSGPAPLPSLVRSVVTQVANDLHLLKLRTMHKVGIPLRPEEQDLMLFLAEATDGAPDTSKIPGLPEHLKLLEETVKSPNAGTLVKEQMDGFFRYAYEEICLRWDAGEREREERELPRKLLTKAVEEQRDQLNQFYLERQRSAKRVEELELQLKTLKQSMEMHKDRHKQELTSFIKEICVLKEQLFRSYKDKNWVGKDVDMMACVIDDDTGEDITIDELLYCRRMVRGLDHNVSGLKEKAASAEAEAASKANTASRLHEKLAASESKAVLLQADVQRLGDLVSFLQLEMKEMANENDQLKAATAEHNASPRGLHAPIAAPRKIELQNTAVQTIGQVAITSTETEPLENPSTVATTNEGLDRDPLASVQENNVLPPSFESTPTQAPLDTTGVDLEASPASSAGDPPIEAAAKPPSMAKITVPQLPLPTDTSAQQPVVTPPQTTPVVTPKDSGSRPASHRSNQSQQSTQSQRSMARSQSGRGFPRGSGIASRSGSHSLVQPLPSSLPTDAKPPTLNTSQEVARIVDPGRRESGGSVASRVSSQRPVAAANTPISPKKSDLARQASGRSSKAPSTPTDVPKPPMRPRSPDAEASKPVAVVGATLACPKCGERIPAVRSKEQVKVADGTVQDTASRSSSFRTVRRKSGGTPATSARVFEDGSGDAIPVVQEIDVLPPAEAEETSLPTSADGTKASSPRTASNASPRKGSDAEQRRASSPRAQAATPTTPGQESPRKLSGVHEPPSVVKGETPTDEVATRSMSHLSPAASPRRAPVPGIGSPRSSPMMRPSGSFSPRGDRGMRSPPIIAAPEVLEGEIPTRFIDTTRRELIMQVINAENENLNMRMRLQDALETKDFIEADAAQTAARLHETVTKQASQISDLEEQGVLVQRQLKEANRTMGFLEGELATTKGAFTQQLFTLGNELSTANKNVARMQERNIVLCKAYLAVSERLKTLKSRAGILDYKQRSSEYFAKTAADRIKAAEAAALDAQGDFSEKVKRAQQERDHMQSMLLTMYEDLRSHKLMHQSEVETLTAQTEEFKESFEALLEDFNRLRAQHMASIAQRVASDDEASKQNMLMDVGALKTELGADISEQQSRRHLVFEENVQASKLSVVDEKMLTVTKALLEASGEVGHDDAGAPIPAATPITGSFEDKMSSLVSNLTTHLAKHFSFLHNQLGRAVVMDKQLAQAEVLAQQQLSKSPEDAKAAAAPGKNTLVQMHAQLIAQRDAKSVSTSMVQQRQMVAWTKVRIFNEVEKEMHAVLQQVRGMVNESLTAGEELKELQTGSALMLFLQTQSPRVHKEPTSPLSQSQLRQTPTLEGSQQDPMAGSTFSRELTTPEGMSPIGPHGKKRRTLSLISNKKPQPKTGPALGRRTSRVVQVSGELDLPTSSHPENIQDAPPLRDKKASESYFGDSATVNDELKAMQRRMSGTAEGADNVLPWQRHKAQAKALQK